MSFAAFAVLCTVPRHFHCTFQNVWKKLEMENSQLPRHLRKKSPPKPAGWGNTPLSSDPRIREAQLDSMNDMAFQASQNQLIDL